MQELQRNSNLLKSNNWPNLGPQVKIWRLYPAQLTAPQAFCFPPTALFRYTALLRISTSPKRSAIFIAMMIRVNSMVGESEEDIGKFARGEV